MRTRLILLAVLSTLNAQLSPARAQGSLTPPGAPAPTMKTLDQIEARSPISSVPFTITVSGSYYLTTNVTVGGGDAIIIATNGVTLDLNGFTISSAAASAAGYGIRLKTGARDITIHNGHIVSGVTNNAGTYSGSGFLDGIRYEATLGPPAVNVRVAGVSVSGCLGNGINIINGAATVVENCTVQTVGFTGIAALMVKNCTALDCSSAISADLATDCRGEAGIGDGVSVNRTASNCYGRSNGSGYGIYATTALNCYGFTITGNGVYAVTVLNCYGASGGSGTGVRGTMIQNSYGSSSSGYGVYAVSTANSCYGSSSTGTGLRALIANSCDGNSFAVSNKYNMP